MFESDYTRDQMYVCCMCVYVCLESESVNECVCACWDNQQIGIYSYVSIRWSACASTCIVSSFMGFPRVRQSSLRLAPSAQFHRVGSPRTETSNLTHDVRRSYSASFEKTAYKCVRNEEIK